MKLMKLTLAVLFLAATAGPAMATQIVTFDVDSAQLTYTAGTSTLVVDETIGSEVKVRIEDDVTATILDACAIDNGDGDAIVFDFQAVFAMTNLPGAENWSAAGTLWLEDSVIAMKDLDSKFQSTSISITSLGGSNFLQIEGVLTCNPGPHTVDSILEPSGGSWVYTGETGIAGEPSGGDASLYLASTDQYDIGNVVVLKFGVPTASLDALFGADYVLSGGEVKGTVTPLPAALPLGILGLAGPAVLGRKMRRLA